MAAEQLEAAGLSRVAELLAAMPDPCVELELRRQLVREASGHAQAEGWHEGYEHGARVLEAQWPSVVTPVLRNRPDQAELERRRWHVCCGPCRRRGHCDGCTRCENRTRETYGLPHPDDFPGREAQHERT